MRSSIARVEIGSRADAGSSIRSTCGLTAMARAMHNRCCWPPDKDEPGRSSRSLTSFHRFARLSDRSTRSAPSDLEMRRLFSRIPASTFSATDIVGNGLGRWKTIPTCRRTATGSTSEPYRSTPSIATFPSTRAPGMTSCMRLSVRMKVDFPQPDGPMIAGEKRMLAKARQILVSELALAEHTEEEKAEAILDEVLAS